MSFRKKTIPIERIAYAYLTIFNFLAIIFLYDYNSFIEIMVYADILLIAIVKAEKVFTAYILSKGTFKGKSN